VWPRPPFVRRQRNQTRLIPYWAKDIKVGFSNINAKAEGIGKHEA